MNSNTKLSLLQYYFLLFIYPQHNSSGAANLRRMKAKRETRSEALQEVIMQFKHCLQDWEVDDFFIYLQSELSVNGVTARED